MTVQWNDTLRNALLDTWESTIGTSAKIRIYSGTPPADETAALSGNTLLVEWSLGSDWMAAASGGSKALTTSNIDQAAAASGTASFYRIYNSAGTTSFEQGTVTATGGGGDMTIDNTTIASGQTVRLTGFTKTAPG